MSPDRIRRIEDRIAIQDLIARYSVARDDRDLRTLVGCFAPDGEFERAGRTVVGRPAIREYFLGSMGRYSTTLHTTHTQMLDWRIDENTVDGLVTGHAELVLDGVLVLAAYRYRDVYRRLDDRWLLGRRWLGFMYAAPADELAAAFRDDRRMRWPGQTPTRADWPESSPTWTTYTEPVG